jgi:prolyl oligopeptidase PreP (S9A serine peptidase family)
LVTPAHAQQLYASLRAKEVPATLLVVTRGGHVPFGPDQERATREFFVRQFGPP